VTRPEQRRRTAKQRILAAADDLFYNEGIHAVGIDRVIARAGVAKGSLYYSFTGKDDLIQEYLSQRHGKWAERITAGIGAKTDPRERILAVYDVLGTLFAQPDYRGCAFMNATAEAAPGSVEAQAATTYRAYDGAVATAQMDKAPEAARSARHTAELILDKAGVRTGAHRATRDSAQTPKHPSRSANPRQRRKLSSA
jgi:AcrR family transcriptional regulator